MVNKLLTAVFGTKYDRDIKKMQPTIAAIAGFEPKLKALSNDDLKDQTKRFKERLDRGESLDSILPEAFATCREASSRVLGMRHYDVQMIGGMSLHSGKISEMRTGEGKTLVATLPVYLNGLTGKGVHVVTVNDYLAKRDCEWMGQLYNWMGLSTGTIVHERTDKERKQNYGADITYGTNNEFGFDYLRDNMKFALEDYVQRPLNYAIVDECDSILIDEARTPLIISGPSDDATEKYYEINKIIPHLSMDVHFTMEEKSKTASLTEEGNHKVEQLLGVGNLYDPQNIQLLHHVYQGLKAHHLYRLDVEYMIKDGEIVIVDEFTGRLMPGRRWSDGLHQAVEAKEGVSIKSENQTLATITFQNYFRMYNKLAGMTGTAETEATEFKKIYNLDVMVIPTHRPISRRDVDDVIYKTENAKYKAIVKDIKERSVKGQPVLVGTVSIEKSEKLSRFLKNEGVTHNVLNAKQHEREAEFVAQAGRYQAVTIATNMAGRGTDIVLGGNAEFMAKAEAPRHAADPNALENLTKQFKAQTEEEKKKVVEAGGLYIIGTERHESRRIDNQLRGRSGRQGDPGESRFYLSLEDNLMRIFNGERLQKIMTTFNFPEDEPIEAGMVTRAIEGAQRKVEGHHFDVRKHLLEYDDVMNQHRKAIYDMRRDILSGGDLDRITLDMLGDVTSNVLDIFVPENAKNGEWDLAGLNVALNQQFGFEIPEADSKKSSAEIVKIVSDNVKAVFDQQKDKLQTFWPLVQKEILLRTIDQRWKEHLAFIDQLKEGISLRAYAQKDPLIEYKKEAFRAFEELNIKIRGEAIEKMLKIQLVNQQNVESQFGQHNQDESEFEYSSPDESTIGAPMMPTRQPGPAQNAPQNGSGWGLPAQGPNQGRTMNREERRRQEKLAKKKK